MEYLLKKSLRARRLRVTVRCDASVVVTAPCFFPQNIIEEFLINKAGWILRKVEYFKRFQNLQIVGGIREYKKVKYDATKFVREKIAKINKLYNFSFNRIRVKNNKSRWGSCSKKRNLNFNYKIIHLPVELAEYIVAHELCHLKEFNHSNRFWALVAKAVPDYNTRRRKLKKLNF